MIRRIRCLSIRDYDEQPSVREIESGEKDFEARGWNIPPGELAIATTSVGGKPGMVRCIVTIGKLPPLEPQTAEDIEIFGIDEPTGPGGCFPISDVKLIRPQSLKQACARCRQGGKHTHLGLYYVEIDDTPRGSTSTPSVARYVAPAYGAALDLAEPADTEPVVHRAAPRRTQLIATPTRSADAGKQLCLPTKTTPTTALRPLDPWLALKHDNDLREAERALREAIAEFGDTAEVRALFGGS